MAAGGTEEQRRMRQHLRPDGKPKRSFESRAEALKFVEPLQMETPVYQCGVCGAWHVASPRRRRR